MESLVSPNNALPEFVCCFLKCKRIDEQSLFDGFGFTHGSDLNIRSDLAKIKMTLKLFTQTNRMHVRTRICANHQTPYTGHEEQRKAKQEKKAQKIKRTANHDSLKSNLALKTKAQQ